MTQSATTLAARVLQMRRSQNTAVAQIKEIAARVEAEQRGYTAAEEAQMERLRTEALGIKSSIDDLLNGVLGAAGNEAHGFNSLGEFGMAVAITATGRKTGRGIDPRIQAYMGAMQAAAPGTAANESMGADGGFLVPAPFAKSLFLMSLDEDNLLPMCDEIPVEGNSMSIPKDESTPWSTDGVRAFWQGEATAATVTKQSLSGVELRLKKLMGLVPVSNELMSDAPALGAYLPAKLASSIRWKTNQAILFGTGVGQPLGAMAGGVPITVPKDTGQATLTLSVTNLATMFARLPPGSQQRAVWLINNDVLPALLTLTLGNAPVFLPAGPGTLTASIAGAPIGTIWGRPVVISQQPNTFGSQGDVLLLDLAYYQVITKAAGVQMATSMHLYFDADTMAFRITFRMDGAPKLTKPISPARGATTMSPFVQLAAR